jgi:hypothetical protein
MRGISTLVPVIALLLSACGGSGTPAESPESESGSEVDSAELGSDTQAPGVGASSSNADGDASETKSSDVPEPQFTENMTVDDAIKAVPQGIERVNIDPETLGKPLQSAELYEPCKPGGARVKMRVAVWDGKAVGLDVTATPKNDRLAGCIKDRIRELTWDKKVKSLNTIEYQL